MDGDRLAAALRTQAQWCTQLGSEPYARLLEIAAADLEQGGAVTALLGGSTGHPNRQALALRMMGFLPPLAGEVPERSEGNGGADVRYRSGANTKPRRSGIQRRAPLDPAQRGPGPPPHAGGVTDDHCKDYLRG